MDVYPIQLSKSGWISTSQQNLPPAGLHVSQRISLLLITASTSVRQSVHCLTDVELTVRASQSRLYKHDPRLTLMYVEVVFTQWTLHRNVQMKNLVTKGLQ